MPLPHFFLELLDLLLPLCLAHVGQVEYSGVVLVDVHVDVLGLVHQAFAHLLVDSVQVLLVVLHYLADLVPWSE